MNKLDFTTIILTIAIIIISIILYAYIFSCKKNNQLILKRRWIEQIPSLISTLGVLGTFWGITAGLWNFDEADLNKSIPLLLNGLKTAFFTSLAGMICSLILSRKVSAVFDDESKGVSDINVAAGKIVEAVEKMSMSNIQTMSDLKAEAIKQANNQTVFYNNASNIFVSIQQYLNQISLSSNTIALQTQAQSSILESVEQYIERLSSISSTSSIQLQAQTNALSSLNEDANAIVTTIGNMQEVNAKKEVLLRNLLGKFNEVSSSVSEIGNISEANISINNEIAQSVSQFTDRLHGEVIDIEAKMEETNQLLSNKFDEFTVLLKQSNTEALVEVMNKVTIEFQKQMSTLINKLVQENFEQLNKSVESLNIWQQENKQMIASLISQYKEMSINFEGTSVVLSQVGSDTKSLVSEGGKLENLVTSLNKVIIEDTHFIEISSNLTKTATLAKENMSQFEESTKSLNKWIDKQRNFVDGVTLLITKLDQLNKIRDYNEEFWRNTKRSLEEGVGIISNGSRTLNEQLKNLDRQFYARLSATLAELDTCIQAMINKNNDNEIDELPF